MFNAQRYMHMDDAYFAHSTIRFPAELKKRFDRILHELQFLDKVHLHHFTLDLDQLYKIFKYRFIQSSSFFVPVTNVELEYMFDTLGFLCLHPESPPYLLYLLEKLVDGLSDERTRPPPIRSTTTTTTTTTILLLLLTIGIIQSFNMEPTTATDVCDGNFKSKNITVHGNATIIKQTGPELVYSVAQWKALELMAIVEEKCPIAQREGLLMHEGWKHLTLVPTIKQESSTESYKEVTMNTFFQQFDSLIVLCFSNIKTR